MQEYVGYLQNYHIARQLYQQHNQYHRYLTIYSVEQSSVDPQAIVSTPPPLPSLPPALAYCETVTWESFGEDLDKMAQLLYHNESLQSPLNERVHFEKLANHLLFIISDTIAKCSVNVNENPFSHCVCYHYSPSVNILKSIINQSTDPNVAANFWLAWNENILIVFLLVLFPEAIFHRLLHELPVVMESRKNAIWIQHHQQQPQQPQQPQLSQKTAQKEPPQLEAHTPEVHSIQSNSPTVQSKKNTSTSSPQPLSPSRSSHDTYVVSSDVNVLDLTDDSVVDI